MSRGFRIFEHTADTGVEAWGATREDALAAAARGLFSLLCDLDSVRAMQKIAFEARGADDVERVVHFLQEALAAWNLRRILLCDFSVEPFAGDLVRGNASGEPYDPGRHEIRGEIKAVTYHLAEVRRLDDAWRIRFIVDI